MLTSDQRAFIVARRNAILVTRSQHGAPRPVPICFVLGEPNTEAGNAQLYSPLDEKPKRTADVRALARVRDIRARPEVALLFERWSEDWSQLAWLRARGSAILIEAGGEPSLHQRVVADLRAKYPQYRAQRIDDAPMLRIELVSVTAWSAGGDLR